MRGLGRFRLAWTEVPAVRVTFIDTLFPGMVDFILIGGGKPDCRYLLHEQGISRHLSRQAGFFLIYRRILALSLDVYLFYVPGILLA